MRQKIRVKLRRRRTQESTYRQVEWAGNSGACEADCGMSL